MFWLEPRRPAAPRHPGAITQPLLPAGLPGGLGLPRRDARHAARALRAAWAAAARAEEESEAAAVAADAEADRLEAGLRGTSHREGGDDIDGGVVPARPAPAYEAPVLDQVLPAVVVAVHEQAARRQQALAGEQAAGQPVSRPSQPIPVVPAAPQPIPVLQAAAPPHPEAAVDVPPHGVVDDGAVADGAAEEAAGAMVPPTPPAGNRWASFFRGRPRG